ncbi:MAG: EAL domain-containing protein [Actinomycetota bacterium]|nr:EAL domain-containing protein [Actinomycetota bacterium]
MLTDFPIQGILDHLVKRIVEIMPITGAGVTLIAGGRYPRYVAASNRAALQFEKLQSDLGEGPCLAAYHTGQAISVPDLKQEHGYPKFAPRAIDAGLTAVFTFPLRHGDAPLGALDLYRDTPGPLSSESMSAAQTLADVAAAYLINAQVRADLQDSSDQARHAAFHDPLTGLPNRALLLQRLEHAFLRGQRSGRTTAVFFVDLDEFKGINDTYGHQVGDELLVAVGDRLTELLRPGDSLARLYGDEFVVLCEDLHDSPEADGIAARFDDALARPFTLSTVKLELRASIGIAFTGRGSEAPAELIHDADLAMYRTKRDKQADHKVFDLRALHLAEHQAGLSRGLAGASGRGELDVAYQPIVSSGDGRLAGLEALMRWTHPSRGAVAPTVFIPFAERSGQIIEMGGWVLEQSWSDRDSWQRQTPAEISMSVNVSAHQFMAAGFVDKVTAVLATSAADARLLTLEVPDGVLVRDLERALIVLGELKAIGVKLALDDFGTGYSSLGHLKQLPVDTIKVGRGFIVDIVADPASSAILTAIVQLAHGLGMNVVAKGVETAEQQRTLSQLGCDLCQGFYFAHPMPAASVAALIRPDSRGGGSYLPSPHGRPPVSEAGRAVA